MLSKLADLLGYSAWRPHQMEAFAEWGQIPAPQRLCLYHKTGAGKTTTALVLMALAGVQHILVIAPPATHAKWQEDAEKLELTVDTISHTKYRQKGYKVARDQAIIADEFHLFGGHGGVGWKKFDKMAQTLQGPIVIMSATPNYNDVERVYCIQHVLDPLSCRGGYLAFLYENCITAQNPFGRTPLVEGFKNHVDAAEYLSALPKVHHLPDDVNISIEDIEVPAREDVLLTQYGLDNYQHRMMASQMEEKHLWNYKNLVYGFLIRDVVSVPLLEMLDQPTVIFSNSKKVAKVLARQLQHMTHRVLLVTGDDSTTTKEEKIEAFRQGEVDILIGTSTLATGTDGLDRVCDQLIILDDTEDAALRRQLIGRILPRSSGVELENKRIIRFVFT